MSQIDKSFVQTLGIPISRVAQAIDKSRQTVNRGIKNPGRNYFKPANLVKALEAWRTEDPALFAVAKNTICDLYPNARRAVLQALEGGTEGTPFVSEIGGEYWLVSGDLIGFRNNLPVCMQQLEALCHLDDTQIKLFVPDTKTQLRAAARLLPDAPEAIVQQFPCPTVDMRLVPTILLRIDDADDLHLYGVSENGFIPLSRHEAARLRTVLKVVAPESEEGNRVSASKVQ